eukprot:scaffold97663_cov52-Phaeocystis_antarctica.AAC.2
MAVCTAAATRRTRRTTRVSRRSRRRLQCSSLALDRGPGRCGQSVACGPRRAIEGREDQRQAGATRISLSSIAPDVELEIHNASCPTPSLADIDT